MLLLIPTSSASPPISQAILLGGEFLHHLCHALADPNILSESSHLTGDPLHALLGLHQGHGHVLDPLHHVGSSRVISLTLLTIDGDSSDAGEEEEEGGGDEERDHGG